MYSRIPLGELTLWSSLSVQADINIVHKGFFEWLSLVYFRSTSPDKKEEKEKEEDIKDAKETKKEEETEKPAASDPETKSRSVSPAPDNDEDDDNLSKEDNAE